MSCQQITKGYIFRRQAAMGIRFLSPNLKLLLVSCPWLAVRVNAVIPCHLLMS